MGVFDSLWPYGVAVAELRHSLAIFTLIALSLLAIYSIALGIYRVLFHPLRCFPGPKIRAVSHLPQSLATFRGRDAAVVRQLHAQYGEVVRLAPDLLSFTTPAAWTDIYGHAGTKRFRKYGYFEIRADAQPLLTANDADYQRQRAALSHGFSEQAILDQEPIIAEHVGELLKKLEEKAACGEPVDLCMWMNFLAFDIVGDFTLSTQFGCVAKVKNHPWVTLMVRWMHAVSHALSASAFGIMAPLLMLSVNKKDLMGIKIHLELSAEKVRERLKAGEAAERVDLWTHILQRRCDHPISLAEMEVNAAALVSAATAPIADVICGTLYLLAKNREELEKLRNELIGQVTSEQDINMSTTRKLPYLNAVINESLRCYPSFPGGTRRQSPAGGAYVSGCYVPEGTIVTSYQLSSFTSASNFAFPDSFLPSRWLPSNHPDRPKATLSDKQDAFNPFGLGPRACLGKGLAFAELRVILARLLWRFNFKLLDDAFKIEDQKAYLFRDRPPLNMALSLRKR